MKTEVIPASAPQTLSRATDLLRQGKLVAFPTDTVYGVGALAFNAQAVQRLYIVKGRSTQKAIAVLVARNSDLLTVARELTPSAQRLALKFWPGALTLVVPKHPNLPRAVSPLSTVGVRQPAHPFALQLLEASGPLAVTSANRSDQPNSLTAEAVLAQLGGRIDLIVDGGQTPGSTPSTVVDCTHAAPKILREGPLSAEEIAAALK